ncbi:ABC-F family ATP-binding cassette domain-containing protein [Irregularibacter muris]|uniref:ABC-F family ATP-binding cassette domain-containing protein n=1 Tax=Irregularibacter muris TaxID=1796619 RepID=A0AAE3HIY3_9FIRM|nr:ABC-F family ATP-binding cassette domain-containing protein [Irregularibacter muris]MCR1899704.1 ABC-F family ATP-binding cassette domain-containing protein [Irregularibacter muris]
MIEIGIKNLEKYYGANKVLEDIAFEVKTGERIGLIGQNGSGKTTLFKIIAGEENYNGGNLTIRKDAVLGFLEQIPVYPEEYTVIDVLHTAFEEIFHLKREMNKLEYEMTTIKSEELERIMDRYGHLQQDFETRGGYDIEEKVSRISAGLHFNEEFLNKKLSLLSGGEKNTVMLGKILLESPEIILLDEPSNHLDFEAIEWLENFLNEYKGTVIIISHDRYFLDRVVTKIIEIEEGKSELYLGNYSYYVDEKERRILDRLEDYKQQMRKIKTMEEAIKRFRDWGTRSGDPRFFKKIANMEKRIERIDKVEKPRVEKNKMDLSFHESKRSGKDVILISEVTKAFENKVLIQKSDLHLRYLDRIGLIGNNGCGKSTLLKMILGKYIRNAEGSKNISVDPTNDFSQYREDEGNIKIGANVKIGYLDQNVTFKNEEHTVLESFREGVSVLEGQGRSILARFLFYDEDVFKKVGNLSGGERSRLKLCQLMHQDINLLLLDEPTNHLDINSREVLEQALMEFEGTLLFVSHDRYFVNKIAGQIVELRDGRLIGYKGNYDDYVEKRKEEKLETYTKEVNHKKKIEGNKNRKSNAMVNNRTEEKERENKKKNLEETIQKLEERIKNIEGELQENSEDYDKLCEIYNQKKDLQQHIDHLLEQWIELE